MTLTTKKTPTPKRKYKYVHITASKKNITKALKCSNISYMFDYNYTSN